MKISDQLKKDIHQAVLAKDQEKTERLRYLYSLLEKEASKQGPLKKEREVAILRREMKQKEEALSVFKRAGRDDLAAREKEEIELLKKYLPSLLGEEEIEKIVTTVIEKTGKRDFGFLMGQVMAQVKGRAEGGTVAQVVKRKLAAKKND